MTTVGHKKRLFLHAPPVITVRHTPPVLCRGKEWTAVSTATDNDRRLGLGRDSHAVVTDAYVSRSFANRAARSVFDISIAIVIGPTPPGTGVIADATPAAAS